jgi:hypothetical protein
VINFKTFGGHAKTLVRDHWLLVLILLIVVVVFFAAPFIWLWRQARGVVAKVSPGAAAAIPQGRS